MIRRLLQSERADDYLIVDTYLKHLVPSRALRAAFDSGIIDRLAQCGDATAEQLAKRASLDPAAVELLLAGLASGNVVESAVDGIRSWSLTRGFRRALRYRDILEAKLDFALHVVVDVTDRFDDLLHECEAFRTRSRSMQLFAYDRCFEATRENLEHAQRWMRISTAFTRYEARTCLNHFPFDEHRLMLDIGGNSGEFALQVCRKFCNIKATVMDLPLVCAIGEGHVAQSVECERITFRPGNALCDPLVEQADLITFKSMLHDWPIDMARKLLTRAVAKLPQGGRILIFERAPIESTALMNAFHLLPMLLFFRSFRSPDQYADWLGELNCDVQVDFVELDLPFFILSAQKR